MGRAHRHSINELEQAIKKQKENVIDAEEK